MEGSALYAFVVGPGQILSMNLLGRRANYFSKHSKSTTLESEATVVSQTAIAKEIQIN